MRPSGSQQELEHRRERAIALLEDGRPPVEVARMVGVDRRSVRRWKSAVRTHGRDAIRARPTPGRPPKLDETDAERLRALLLKGARAAGYSTDLWTCPRVAQVIGANFGVTYHVDHVGRLLHSLGFSPQKPTKRALERNEDGIRQWVEKDWPHIKKRPAD